MKGVIHAISEALELTEFCSMLEAKLRDEIHCPKATFSKFESKNFCIATKSVCKNKVAFDDGKMLAHSCLIHQRFYGTENTLHNCHYLDSYTLNSPNKNSTHFFDPIKILDWKRIFSDENELMLRNKKHASRD